MALKTWAPFDRLIAEDLNGAFHYAAGDGAVPGAICTVNGPAIAITTANNMIECKFGTPAAGDDPFGFHTGATGHIKVPVGMGGLYLVQVTFGALSPATTGAAALCQLIGITTPGVSEIVVGYPRAATSLHPAGTASLVRRLADAQEISAYQRMFVADSADARIMGWSILRLGVNVGAIGA